MQEYHGGLNLHIWFSIQKADLMQLPNKRQWQRWEPRWTKSLITRTASRSKVTTGITVNP